MICQVGTYRVITIPATIDDGGPFSMDRPAYEQERIDFAEPPCSAIAESLESIGFMALWACERRAWVK